MAWDDSILSKPGKFDFGGVFQRKTLFLGFKRLMRSFELKGGLFCWVSYQGLSKVASLEAFSEKEAFVTTWSSFFNF